MVSVLEALFLQLCLMTFVQSREENVLWVNGVHNSEQEFKVANGCAFRC